MIRSTARMCVPSASTGTPISDEYASAALAAPMLNTLWLWLVYPLRARPVIAMSSSRGVIRGNRSVTRLISL